MKHIFILIIIALPHLAFAQSACIDPVKVADVIKDYNLYRHLKHKKSWQKITQIQLCDPNSRFYKVVNAILFLQPKVPVTDDFQLMTQSPLDFFHDHVKNIYFSDNTDENCSENVDAYQSDGAQIYICPSAKDSFTSNAIASSVLIHEARHVDGFDHVKCTHGDYARIDRPSTDDGSCDTSFEETGSYGVETSYLVLLSRDRRLSPTERQASRLGAIKNFIQRFNQVSLGITSGFLWKDSTRNDLRFSDGPADSFFVHLDPDQIPTISDGILHIFSRNHIKSQIFLGGSQYIDASGPFVDVYRQLGTAERASILDIMYSSLSEDFGCFLFQGSLDCVLSPTDHVEIKFNQIKPVRFVITEDQTYILDSEGQLYTVPQSWKELVELTEPSFLKSRIPQSNLNISNKILGPFIWSPRFKDL